MGNRSRSASSGGFSFHAGSLEDKPKKKARDKERPRVGGEIYIKFEQQVVELDKELRKLSNKARKLGSSAGILSASTRLRERLGRVLHVFRLNAKDLYPEEIQTHMNAHPTPLKPVRRWKAKNFLDHQHWKPSTNPEKYENIAMEFRLFSKDVMTLFDCFSQFPQFVEELPDWSLAEELEVWANSLDNFEHEFATLAVQKYLYDSMADIGIHLEALAKRFIPTFTKLGIPTVGASQDRGISNLENQTIVATLFAGIATGMLQIFSDSTPPGALHTATIILWYISLIFSIASAVNGLLGLSWTQAIYRSPDRHVPWWILIWIKRFPLLFLVLAIACSFAALILIALTSQQSRASLALITAFSVFACFGLLAVSCWFVCELLVFVHYEGRMWLVDVIHDLKGRVTAAVVECCIRVRASGKDLINYKQRNTDIEQDQPVPTIGFNRPSPSRADSNVSFWMTVDKNTLQGQEKIRHLWHEAVRRVIDERRQQTGRPPLRHSLRFSHLTNFAMNTLRYQSITTLRSMTISLSHHVNEKHAALVRSLQFSPDGRYLVTSSWDSQSFLFRINTPVLCERVLLHPAGSGYVHHVDWSPDGNKLLMRSNKKLIVWELDADEKDGKIRQANMIVQHQPDAEDHTIRSVAWNGNGSEFFSVQGKRVLTMDTTGRTLRDYPTQHLELRGLCVTSDSRWMICVGKYLHEEQRSARKFGIIVWDLRNHKVAKTIPVYYDMNNVALSSDDRSVLISYENKSPSQFWQLQIDRTNTDFILCHSYMPKENTSFAALPSIFGGEDDHLVLRAGSVGDIYVWDRDSASLVYIIKAPPILQGQFTSFAWNRGYNSKPGKYMFATGTHDGSVHIWAVDSEELKELKELEEGEKDGKLKRESEGGLSVLDGKTVVSSTSRSSTMVG